jgi:arsenate reductase-like glutaredoxin family protein
MSKGEFTSVRQAVGGLDKLINTEGKDKDLLALIKYLSSEDVEAKLLENPKLFLTPIVRNGKLATVGYQPEIWKHWE